MQFEDIQRLEASITATTSPALILENTDLANAPVPVLGYLMKVGSCGFMVAFPGDAPVCEAVDMHLCIDREDSNTFLRQMDKTLPAQSGRSNAGTTMVCMMDVPELSGSFRKSPLRMTAWPPELHPFRSDGADVVKPKHVALVEMAGFFRGRTWRSSWARLLHRP